MRVLYISNYSGILGGNLAMLELMIEAKKNGVTPICLIPNKGPICKYLEKEEIKYIVSKYYLAYTQNHIFHDWLKGIVKSFANIIFYTIALIKVLHNCGKVDIIHSNTTVLHIGEFFKLVLNVPHIKHLRECAKDSYGLSYCWGEKAEFLIRKLLVDKAIAISDYVLSYYQKCGFKSIELVYDGVGLDRVFKKSVNPQNEECHILCMGGVNKNKNQLQIVQAVDVLVKKYNANVILDLLGDDSNEYGEMIKQYACNNKIENHICYHGMQSDISKYIKRADIGICASYSEAFGRTTVEYMLNHVPVIVSNTSANITLVKDGIDGLVYDINKTETLVECIRKCILNYDETKKRVEKAYEKAMSLYTSVANAKKIITLYHFLLNQ